MGRMFQITEGDLAELERIAPQLNDYLMTAAMTNRQRTQLRRVKEILSNVRWNYCPPGEVIVIPADDRPTPEPPHDP